LLIFEKCLSLEKRFDELNKIFSGEITLEDEEKKDFINEKENKKNQIKLKREFANLEDIIDLLREFNLIFKTFLECEEIISSGPDKSDIEIVQLAKEEIHDLKKKIDEFLPEIKKVLLPKDENDSLGVILEVRAGTGGDEAALFASEIFRMYMRFADLKGFKFEIMEKSEIGGGGRLCYPGQQPLAQWQAFAFASVHWGGLQFSGTANLGSRVAWCGDHQWWLVCGHPRQCGS
jgi:peptide chain release factor 1